MNKLNQALQAYKQQRQASSLWRERACYDAVPLRNNFSSNDYLALSRHPAVIAAFQQGLEQWGTGSGGSPLTTGYQAPHRALEEQLCDWLGFESALLFSSGYAANQGTLQALGKLGITPLLDRLSHASLYAGALQALPAHKPLLRFKHNDMAHLRQQLASLNSDAAAVIVSEGLFSMDGDNGPFDQLIGLKQQQLQAGIDTLLLIDDAHGLGSQGIAGQGSLSQAQRKQIDLFSATFSKALGCQGAFVGGNKSWIEYLVQTAGEYIYSTAMPAAQACAVLAAIQLVREQTAADSLQQRLANHIQQFRALAEQHGLQFMPSTSAIQPLVVGRAERALYLSQGLQQQGFTCVAIRPPTVAQGQARLRFTVTLHQTPQSMARLFQALASLMSQGTAMGGSAT